MARSLLRHLIKCKQKQIITFHRFLSRHSEIRMDLTNSQLLTHLRDVEVLAEDVLADKQVNNIIVLR